MPSSRWCQCDLHTHTELSGEAQSQGFSLSALFRTADELGLRYVGYSEHWHLGTPVDLFRRIRDEVERLQPHFRAKVYVSAEIDVLNSRGDLACDSVRMNADWLPALYGADKLAIERSSFGNFTRAVVAQRVRLAPGSDAHHLWWHDGATRCFGNNAESLALLQTYGYQEEQLWYGPAAILDRGGS